MEKIGCFGTQITQNTQIIIVSAESARSAWNIYGALARRIRRIRRFFVSAESARSAWNIYGALAHRLRRIRRFFLRRERKGHTRLQGPCLVPALKGPTPTPSLRREGNNHPRREYGYPKKVSDDMHPLYTHNVHPLAGAVPRRRTVARSAQHGPIYTQATAHCVLRASSRRLGPSTAVTIPPGCATLAQG